MNSLPEVSSWVWVTETQILDATPSFHHHISQCFSTSRLDVGADDWLRFLNGYIILLQTHVQSQLKEPWMQT